ncbi:MAG: hypothetical protein JWQ51_2681, partial [Tardiphaga sp.]|nr:hypothetical protein [Tardiphaga sp.]
MGQDADVPVNATNQARPKAMASSGSNAPRRTLLLTGASR